MKMYLEPRGEGSVTVYDVVAVNGNNMPVTVKAADGHIYDLKVVRETDGKEIPV